MPTLTSVIKFFPKPKEAFVTTTNGTTTSGATSVVLNSVTGYSDGDVVALVIDPADPLKKQVFTGTVNTGGLSVTGVVWTEGSNVEHASGATVVDYITATHLGMVSKGMLIEHNQNGTHAAITATSLAASAGVTVGTTLAVTGASTFTGAVSAVAGVTPRVTTTASSAAPTPNASTTDVYAVTALAEAATFGAPTGTPAHGQSLLIRIEDNGTIRTLGWNAIYRVVGVTLPTATVANKLIYVGCVYNSTDTKWDVIAIAREA